MKLRGSEQEAVKKTGIFENRQTNRGLAVDIREEGQSLKLLVVHKLIVYKLESFDIVAGGSVVNVDAGHSLHRR